MDRAVPSPSANDFSAELLKIMERPENKVCADCSRKNPDWASVTFGICLCLECAGKHRALGSHITFVRSLKLDKWSEIGIAKMKVGGNIKAKQFFRSHGLDNCPIQEKYASAFAKEYSFQLEKEAQKISADLSRDVAICSPPITPPPDQSQTITHSLSQPFTETRPTGISVQKAVQVAPRDVKKDQKLTSARQRVSIGPKRVKSVNIIRMSEHDFEEALEDQSDPEEGPRKVDQHKKISERSDSGTNLRRKVGENSV